jgi:flavodoxin
MEKKILIAYYSHSGNTKKVAESIKKVTSGTLFEIQSKERKTKRVHSCFEI